LVEGVPQQEYSILKIATLTEPPMGLGKQVTCVSAEAQEMTPRNQRDDELKKTDGKVAFASKRTGSIFTS
jgi:hypothetical protein